LAVSDASVDAVKNWSINWGDGKIDNLAGNPSTATHVYADGPSSYTISASVTTDDGSFAAGNTVAVKVNNLPPLLTVSNPAVLVNAGQTATNTGTFADVGHDPVTLSASIGTVTEHTDGTWSWSFATTGSNQSQTVTITAIDDDGASAKTSFQLTVKQGSQGSLVITSLVVSQPKEKCGSGEGKVILAGTFADADPRDRHTVIIAWGDGTASEILRWVGKHHEFTASHHYARAGRFVITVTVRDGDDGGQATKTATAVVNRGDRLEDLIEQIYAIFSHRH
jgi:hypothetical protein